jgi:hypothetical protein
MNTMAESLELAALSLQFIEIYGTNIEIPYSKVPNTCVGMGVYRGN